MVYAPGPGELRLSQPHLRDGSVRHVYEGDMQEQQAPSSARMERNGPFPPKPKGMHGRRWLRLVDECLGADRSENAALGTWNVET